MVRRRGNSVVERAEILVIDASVAVKWYVEEEGRSKALQLRNDFFEGKLELVSPALVLYEVFNALRYHPGLSAGDISLYVDSLLDMQLDLRMPTVDTNNLAAKLALKEGISGYDAQYLALARKMQTSLITADTKLTDRLSKETKANVSLLRDYARRSI